MKKPPVGISTCLLGEKVRYDGGHKLDRYPCDVLSLYVDFVPVCPEVECGMTIPREAMRLIDNEGTIHLVMHKTQKDMTGQMVRWMEEKLDELARIHLCGYIFKKNSPNCGLMHVNVYKNNSASRNGMGIFARGFTERNPLLPVEEEGRLNDDRLRENFIERIFVMHRWHELNANGLSLNNLMEFHARHKYSLMAHCPQTLRELGAYIASAKKYPVQKVYNGYFEKFITAFGKITTIKKNTSVLQHIMGYFKKYLNKDEKEELQEIIIRYHDELVPLVVPITLLNHYARKYQPSYLEGQYYLNPHPMELMLRNRV